MGVAALAGLPATEMVVGIDPSTTMVALAHRRNRRAIDAGRVALHRAARAGDPLTGGRLDAVIAVNSMQLWEPLDPTVAEVARVVRRHGELITMTHAWAIEKVATCPAWTEATSRVLTGHGFRDITVRTLGRSGQGPPWCCAPPQPVRDGPPRHRTASAPSSAPAWRVVEHGAGLTAAAPRDEEGVS